MAKTMQIHLKGGYVLSLDDKFNLVMVDRIGKKVPKTKVQNIINFNLLKKISHSLKG